MVAKGFTQIEGVDFNEVYSPVVKHCSIRLMLALVTQWDLEVEQLDVKTTFLHGELEETIFMEQPEGYSLPKTKDKVCLPKKSLYGLKQSPRQWNRRFNEFMKRINFSAPPIVVSTLKVRMVIILYFFSCMLMISSLPVKTKLRLRP